MVRLGLDFETFANLSGKPIFRSTWRVSATGILATKSVAMASILCPDFDRRSCFARFYRTVGLDGARCPSGGPCAINHLGVPR